ncbi:MAG: hypothetical protein KGO96_02775 [Elusimicrobia bacterium]|nr:hypothetical protein [Elusimicrobiota bacterium]MDE2236358.1 hypothetical protein [Elusimicrobiota bacterium]MDE2424817.1 hypothetical protein [Elusimicrobiota bacterium]
MLALGSGLIGFASVLGHLFANQARYGAPSLFPHSEIAPATSVALVILSAGTLVARPERGMISALTGDRPGAIAAKTILAGLTALAPVIVLLALGARLGWYPSSTAAALIVFIGAAQAVSVVFALAKRLNEIEEARRRAQRLREEVIGMTSHELQNPLTTVLLTVRGLLGGAAGDLNERATTMLRLSERAVERMVRLIEDFLNLEKLESGQAQLRIEAIELEPLLADLVAGMSLGDSAGRIVLRAARGIHVEADRERLACVVANFISNALKYSPPDRPVELVLSQAERTVRVCVRDHGPGIPAEFQPHVFQRFARAADAGTRGTGLGLSICKAIVDQMGGRIGFESTAGEGTVFFFELAACEPQS